MLGEHLARNMTDMTKATPELIAPAFSFSRVGGEAVTRSVWLHAVTESNSGGGAHRIRLSNRLTQSLLQNGEFVTDVSNTSTGS